MNAKDLHGYTPLHLVVYTKHEEIDSTINASSQHLQQIDTFAVASNMQGGDKVPGHNDFVLLHFVATQGSLSIVDLLLGHDHPECRADKYRPMH